MAFFRIKHVSAVHDAFAVRRFHPSSGRWFGWLLCLAAVGSAGLSLAWVNHAQASPAASDTAVVDGGTHPHPAELRLPPDRPLSVVARLGRRMFFDPALSASGRQSCASCHDPAHGYNPPNGQTLQPGGAHMGQLGFRPPLSLAYLYRQQPFSIGPDAGEVEAPVNLNTLASAAGQTARAQKSAGATPASVPMVPMGGLFWDGRAASFQRQALVPMLNPVEMANTSIEQVATKLATSPYHAQFQQLFGEDILKQPDQLVSEAMFAISRFETEDASFHPFTSKYDAWLQGKARLSAAEMRGLDLFNDPQKGNCAACHLSKVTPDRLPPLFTDTQYEALGVPRNPALPMNSDPHFHDLGLCGPFRTDLARQTQYCGMFVTPTLRNVDRRQVFFHNGIYHTLKQVLDFYNLRAVAPEKIYPRDANGKPAPYNDLPAAYRANVDTTDAPFDRHVGDKPALTDQDIQDIITFLHTLNDGYTSREGKATAAPRPTQQAP
ncbi:cytochrome-c peroxidase [Rhodanobacter sp. Col0626]|uniref:cytochrome-c peroxidase n=1 Tax=Rhodanobacter sp. Col0626 TaxID=3415679 RepID=UPI003CF5AA67